jgi:hypothetical protein
MKEIKLTDKQIEIIENIQLEKGELEKRLNELNIRTSIVMGLIFDSNKIDMPEQAIYEDGLIKYE